MQNGQLYIFQIIHSVSVANQVGLILTWSRAPEKGLL